MKDYSAMSDFDIQQEVLQETWGKHPVRLLGKMMLDIMLSDYDPCNNPADAWPIIKVNKISMCCYERDNHGMKNEIWWEADVFTDFITRDANPLRAAMIVYLKMMEQKS